MSGSAAQPRPGHTEQLVTFGDGGRLVGTLTLPGPDAGPLDPGTRRPALLLFNAGVISRIGPHRLNVKLARRAAEAGITTFRFDLSGQGDSRAGPGTLTFEDQSRADLRQAMDAVAARTAIDRFMVFGICSGAVLGHAAALEDPRLVGCMMLDPYMYPTRRTHVTRILAKVRRHGLREVAMGWLVRRVTPTGRRRARMSSGGPIGSSLGLQRPAQADFAAELERLLQRQVRLLMIYSGSALYTYSYAGQFDDGFRRFGLAGRIRADHLPQIDHTVTPLAAQRLLIDHLLRWIDTSFPAAPSPMGSDVAAPTPVFVAIPADR
jgi:pimeloyl-ACP methyl ester carboxylesterase